MNRERSGVTAGKPCLPPFSKEQQRYLLEDLLRDVSRSFYLTLRVLPKEIRPQVSLAYLLARASDTIADTKAVPKQERIGILKQMRDSIHNPSVEATFLSRALLESESRQECRSHGEATLLRCLPDCLASLASFSDSDRMLMCQLLDTIIGGQIFDLEQFPGESEHELVALASDEELDRYTYMVAGCVGEFWTKTCVTHLKELECWKVSSSAGATADKRVMEELGVRFGKGLQLVNVLRDIPKDLRIGRCYLPVKDPRALLAPANYDSIRPEYTKWLDRAVEHLEAGWQYTMEIPPKLWRLRLACIWPIWIGLKTIARLRTGNPLDPTHRIKVSRGEVYSVMARSFLVVRNDAALNRAFQKLLGAASRR